VILYLQCQEKNYISNDKNIKFIKKLKKEALRERFVLQSKSVLIILLELNNSINKNL
jgi:hypothetical protein